MSAYDRMFADPPAILTRAELDQLRADRDNPRPVYHPMPPGHDMSEALHSAVKANERRIALHEQRFEELGKRIDCELRFAALRGRSKVDFDRSR